MLIGVVVLLLVSVIVALGAAEIGLRLLGYRGEPISRITNIYLVNDPVLDWRYVPNSEVRSGRTVYHYNAAGFRDVDHAQRKPAGVTRIIALGDSVTEGYEVELNSIFARALQTKLGDKYEVINIAAGGLNTPQEIHLLERVGMGYEPDVVVVNFVLNDADFYTQYAPALRAGEQGDSRIAMLNVPIPPVVKRALKSSAAIYMLKDGAESIRARLLGTASNGNYYDRLWANPTNRRKVTDAFARLAALQRQGRFEVLIMIWPLITDYSSYRFQPIHAWVADEARKAGFPVVDLLPQFSPLPYRTLQVSAEDAVHPNAKGHRIGVEAFATWYQSPNRSAMGR